MNNFKDTIFGWVGTGITSILAATQTREVFQIIELIVAILVGLVTLAYTIYKWYKRATADGKITEEEVDELVEEVKPVVNGVRTNGNHLKKEIQKIKKEKK